MKTRSPHRSQQGDERSSNCPSFSLPECFNINNTVSEITTQNEASSFSSHTQTHSHTHKQSQEKTGVVCEPVPPVLATPRHVVQSVPVVCHVCLDNMCPRPRLLGVFGLTLLALRDAASEVT